MAAAEERSKFKFVSLQRTNLKSNYKKRFKSLAGKQNKRYTRDKTSERKSSIEQ